MCTFPALSYRYVAAAQRSWPNGRDAPARSAADGRGRAGNEALPAPQMRTSGAAHSRLLQVTAIHPLRSELAGILTSVQPSCIPAEEIQNDANLGLALLD